MISGRYRGVMLAVCVFMLLAADPSRGAKARVEAMVVRTLTTDDGRLGGCMVRLDQALSDFGLDCPGSWVTFSCRGIHTSVAEAVRMFESAQLAFTLEHTAMVEVTDEKKHNGHCYGTRVDVLKD